MKAGMALIVPPISEPENRAEIGSKAEKISPGRLAAAHPSLQADIAAYSPWKQETAPGECFGIPEEFTPCWTSKASAVSALPDGSVVLVCGACSSSLDVAWRLQRMDALPPWTSVLALAQTSGRGQLRREWRSPAGNVYAALRLPQKVHATGDMAPLAVGYALLRGVQGVFNTESGQGDRLRLKWPNDLLLDGRKVGGLLLEERSGALIAGIGLNLIAPPDLSGLEREPGAPDVGSFEGAGAALEGKGPLRTWAGVLAGMHRALESFMPLEDLETLAEMIGDVLAWRGRSVLVRGGGATDPTSGFDNPGGVIVGIAVDGALRLASSAKESRLRSGSIVLAQP